MSEAALVLEGVVRRFRQGQDRLDVLRGVSLTLMPGEIVALVGPSGAGKSTLLQIAGLLERPSEGEVRVVGRACGALSDGERTRVRREGIGFVYQFHHLLPEFTALENVVLPRMINGRTRRDAREHAGRLLASVGLGERLTHRPAQLSGGEQQRVAIARALANAPALLLADEPTGNLDEATAEVVAGTFFRAVREARAAALIATHNPEFAARMDRTFRLHDGQLSAS